MNDYVETILPNEEDDDNIDLIEPESDIPDDDEI